MILVCPHCDVPLTSVDRHETIQRTFDRVCSMTFRTQPTDRLRRMPPSGWRDVRYWCDTQRMPEERAVGDETTVVSYSCPWCRHAIDPELQGWVDPLQLRSPPPVPLGENSTDPQWEEYTRFGHEPSLIQESVMVEELL